MVGPTLPPEGVPRQTRAMYRHQPKLRFLWLLGAVSVAWLNLPAPGQDRTQIDIAPRAGLNLRPRTSSLRAEVNMVIIPALVTDQFDRPVLDLRKDEFHLFEGDHEQKIQSLAIDEAPASIGIVFDSSGSMANKINNSRDAVRRLLGAGLPEDEFFLVQFSDMPKLLVRFTPQPDEIVGQLNSLRPEGWTSMFDAIYLAINQMRYARNPLKALLILSDGGDNYSRYTQTEVMHALQEADVRVFAIGLFDDASFLRKAANETGGSVIVVHKMKDLVEAVEKTNASLRSEYLLGYYPPQNQADGKFHKVKLTVNRTIGGRKVRTSWRHGYYAP
jgi:Ca-activated chloride channel homolog